MTKLPHFLCLSNMGNKFPPCQTGKSVETSLQSWFVRICLTESGRLSDYILCIVSVNAPNIALACSLIISGCETPFSPYHLRSQDASARSEGTQRRALALKGPKSVFASDCEFISISPRLVFVPFGMVLETLALVGGVHLVGTIPDIYDSTDRFPVHLAFTFPPFPRQFLSFGGHHA